MKLDRLFIIFLFTVTMTAQANTVLSTKFIEKINKTENSEQLNRVVNELDKSLSSETDKTRLETITRSFAKVNLAKFKVQAKDILNEMYTFLAGQNSDVSTQAQRMIESSFNISKYSDVLDFQGQLALFANAIEQDEKLTKEMLSYTKNLLGILENHTRNYLALNSFSKLKEVLTLFVLRSNTLKIPVVKTEPTQTNQDSAAMLAGWGLFLITFGLYLKAGFLRRRELSSERKKWSKLCNDKEVERQWSENKSRLLMRGIGEALVVTDKKGKVIESNKKSQALLGRYAKNGSTFGRVFPKLFMKNNNLKHFEGLYTLSFDPKNYYHVQTIFIKELDQKIYKILPLNKNALITLGKSYLEPQAETVNILDLVEDEFTKKYSFQEFEKLELQNIKTKGDISIEIEPEQASKMVEHYLNLSQALVDVLNCDQVTREIKRTGDKIQLLACFDGTKILQEDLSQQIKIQGKNITLADYLTRVEKDYRELQGAVTIKNLRKEKRLQTILEVTLLVAYERKIDSRTYDSEEGQYIDV